MYLSLLGWVFAVTITFKPQSKLDTEARQLRDELRQRATARPSHVAVTTPSQPERAKRDKSVTLKKAATAAPKLCPVCKKTPLTGRKQSCSEACRQAKSRANKKTALSKRRS